MTRTADDTFGYGGDALAYAMGSPWCHECNARVQWPESPSRHREAHAQARMLRDERAEAVRYAELRELEAEDREREYQRAQAGRRREGKPFRRWLCDWCFAGHPRIKA